MKEKAFTLIELLAVITIIGIIASIVLVFITDSKNKTRIARGQRFEQSLNNALTNYAVGAWSLDRYVDPVSDLSGNDNHCKIFGASATSGMVGEALSFNGVNYLDCGNGESLYVVKEITITAWIRPRNTAGTRTIVGRHTSNSDAGGTLRIQDSRIQFLLNVNNTFYNVSSHKPSIILDEWQFVAVVYNGSKVIIYQDGEEIYSEEVSPPPLAVSFPRTSIGSHVMFNQEFFNGIIDEVKIYDEAVETSEIKKHYVESKDNYKLAGK